MKKSINKKIVANTTAIVVVLAVILMIVMALSMKVLTREIMADVLPSTTKMASQSIESNMHMMADRIFMISDRVAIRNPDSTMEEKEEALNEAQSGIEFVWLGLYKADGSLYLGDGACPASIGDKELFSLLQETQNLAVDDVDSAGGELELAIGIPVTSGEELLYYLVGSYKYDVLNDVLSNINLSANGEAYIVNSEGSVMGCQDTELVKNQKGLEEVTKFKGIKELVTTKETGVVSMGKSLDAAFVSHAPINGTRWYLALIVPQRDFMGPANTGILLSLGITFVLLVLAGIYTMRFSSKIQRSLRGVTDRIGLLAQGDLTTPTEVIKTNDETEVLSYALSNTVDSINGYISELSHILENMSGGNFQVDVRGEFEGDFVVMKESLNKIIGALNQMLKAIKNSSDEVLETARVVSESAQQVHNGSRSQSDSLNVLSEETTAIEQNILQVDENTKTVGGLMETAQQHMETGDDNMKNLLQAMEDINRNSVEITKINKFLEDISFQTNILALNASIEAARAGAAGSGFAIVAEEVGNLASQSAESSKRTTSMIDSSLKAVERGTEYARKVAESFHDIGEISDQISKITEQLAENVAVQKHSLGNMTGQITQIRDVAQQNLNASYESTTASQKLNGQAQSLQKISGSFRLREE